jgi:uncharacterized protein (TIGR02452 family)
MAHPPPSWFSSFVPLKALHRSPYSYPSLAIENIAIYQAGRYFNQNGTEVLISEAQEVAAKSSQIFPPTSVFDVAESGSLPGEIEITGETTIGALHRLIEIDGEPNSVALNFANPVEPGGGFRRGAIAQEEAICRCSVLYDLLTKLHEMYANVDFRDPIFTDYMTLIRNVPIIRDDEYDFLEKPFFGSFITCAAPLAFQYWAHETDGKRLYDALEGRIRKIVKCAIAARFTNIVLGAFGCGAFGNSSQDVAAMFRDVLIKENLRSHFRKIIFAIYSPPSEENKREIFSEALLGQRDTEKAEEVAADAE